MSLFSSTNHRFVDLGLQHVGWLEHKNLPGKDRNLFAGLRIAANALVFGADLEGTEGGQLDVGAGNETVPDQFEYPLNQFRRLGSRQSYGAIDCFGEIGPRYRLLRHSYPRVAERSKSPRRDEFGS